MRWRSIGVVVASVTLSACVDPAGPATAPQPSGAQVIEQCEAIVRRGPPPTPRGDTIDQLHGVWVADPYRWLEDITDPAVVAWADAQDAFARAQLHALPRRETLRQALRAKIDVPTVSLPIRRGERSFYARRQPGHDHAVWFVRDGDRPERVLLDPLVLDPRGRTTIRRPVPSPDGRSLAYLTSLDGADESTMRVLDVDTGTHWPEAIAGGRYAVAAWNHEGTAFAYTGLPDDDSIAPPDLPAHAEVRVHRLGTAPANDERLFGPLGDAATFVSVESIDRGRQWVLSLSHDWTATDVYVRPSTTAPQRGTAGWKPLFVGHDALASVSALDGRYFVLTNAGAPRYRVVEIDPRHPDPSHWREVIPQSPDQILEDASVIGGRLLVQSMRDASSTLAIHELSGARVAEVDLRGPGSVTGVAGTTHDDTAFVLHSALHRAPTIEQLSMRDGAMQTWSAANVPMGADLVVRQVWIPSADGTPVSAFILHRDDLPRDRPAPTMLTGYGGFGVAMRPGFSATAAVWAERGGVWVLANLRGGGEFGEAWHEAGRRANKHNTFDDFIAVAEYLHAQGYSVPSSLAIRGGSNGGLLVGATSTQRPDLLGAVVCAVPLLDMLRFHHYGSGPTWMGEYGNPEVAHEFRWLWGYSPLHKVRSDADYPALLMLSADNDDRVDPMHARKFVAAMQHAGADALLRIERGAGHGGSPRVGDRIDAEVDTLAFVLDHLTVAADDDGPPL